MADSKRSVKPAVVRLVAAILLVAGANASRAADRELYFSKMAHDPLAATPIVYGPRDSIQLTLNLRTSSSADRARFPPLVIDHRLEPNVRFEVIEMRKGVEYLPASFRIDGQRDRQVDGPYQMADVWFLLGRSQPFYHIADHFGLLGRASDKHWEGTYRIRAFYREFSSPPIFVTVR